jgi:hypothetical protein
MAQTVQILRTTTNNPPPALLPGAFSVELGAKTRLWIGSAGGNRLLLSSDPADLSLSGSGYLPLTGGTLTGSLTLSGAPTVNLHAATKLYVDNAVAPLAPLASPIFTGDPRAPTPATADNDTSVATTAFVKAQGYAAGGPFLPLSGGALTGPLTSSTFISVAGNINTAGNYQIASQPIVAALGGAGGRTTLYDGSARDNLDLGGAITNQNTHQNSTHFFGSIGAATAFATFNSAGCANVSGAWFTLSDIRIKEDVEDYVSGLDVICQLRPVTFKYNGRAKTARDGRTLLGFVADELEPVMPELVRREPRHLDPDDEELTELLTAEPTNVVYALVNAVRELRDRVAALEAP